VDGNGQGAIGFGAGPRTQRDGGIEAWEGRSASLAAKPRCIDGAWRNLRSMRYERATWVADGVGRAWKAEYEETI